jgi:hypothetical protein
MRGESDRQLPWFHFFEVEDRFRSDHPLRDIKRRTDRILAGMSKAFDAAYSTTGRPSVPPERLLKALLLMAPYAEVDFHGEKRTNETHQSRTDPESRLYRNSSGQESKLSHMGHVFGENCHGLILGITATEANGTAERTAALVMIDELKTTHGLVPATTGGDKGYDSGPFFLELETRGIEPHVPLILQRLRSPGEVKPAERAGAEARVRMSRRMRKKGYRLSQRCRKKVEECFNWLKTVAELDRCRTVGRWKLKQLLELGAPAFNIVRLRRLAPTV